MMVLDEWTHADSDAGSQQGKERPLQLVRWQVGRAANGRFYEVSEFDVTEHKSNHSMRAASLHSLSPYFGRISLH